MSYFDDASLVFIPSGTKTSKAYSVKPIDGTGDLTFTRSNDTATRVNSAGLIEKVRTNLLLQSEAFDSASWTKNSSAINTAIGTSGIQANVALAPDGTTTADRVNFINQSDSDIGVFQTISISPSITYTSSFYIKGEGSDVGKQVRIKLKRASGGTSVSTTNTYTLTADWVRVPTSLTMAVDNTNFQVIISSDIGGAVTCLLWGAQVEASDVMTDYIRTSTAAVSVGPVANVPRLDYLNSSCPRLNLEPQRVNLTWFSENFDNSYHSKNQASITANNAVSPDGYTNADKLIPNTTSTDDHRLSGGTLTVTSGAAYTTSVFAKNGGYNVCSVRAANGGTVQVNLTTGAKTEYGSVTSSSVVDYGNGWYRISVTANASSTSYAPAILVQNSTASQYPIWSGNGTDGILLYGFMTEAGAYVTSYIPTLGSASTRGADAASKTGISSLIGQTEGTLFFEIKDTENFLAYLGVDNLSTGTRILIYGAGDQKVYTQIRNSSTVVFGAQSAAISGAAKAAVSFNSSGSVFYVNGVQVGTGSGTTYTNLSQLTFNHSSQVGAILNQALLFKTRLTNAQLAELTSL